MRRLRGIYPRALAWIVPAGGHRLRRVTRAGSSRPTVVMPGYTYAYVRNLRRSARGAVWGLPFRQPGQYAPPPNFAEVDIFHLHFVDALGRDVDETRELIGQLQEADTKIVWTAHDLTPHSKRHDIYEPIFQMWADAADGVIHHSRWGQQQMVERYRFRATTRHTVIENRYRLEHLRPRLAERRAEIESRLGLGPVAIRIGMIGNPRVERKVVEFLEGVVRSFAEDIEVVCWSLRSDEVAPADPRIAIAQPYEYVSDSVLCERLAVCDLIALPIDPAGEMLTTGLTVDAVAMGLGILISEWEFLRETCGAAAISCGHTADSVAACLDALSADQVQAARGASRRLREGLSWQSARDPLLHFYRSVLQGSS